jgi:hypothetical protein
VEQEEDALARTAGEAVADGALEKGDQLLVAVHHPVEERQPGGAFGLGVVLDWGELAAEQVPPLVQ